MLPVHPKKGESSLLPHEALRRPEGEVSPNYERVDQFSYGDMSSLCTSSAKASAISLLPTFAIAWRAKQLLTSLFSSKSFRIELTTNLSRSEFSCINNVTARYPLDLHICARQSSVSGNSGSRWQFSGVWEAIGSNQPRGMYVRSASRCTLDSK